MRRSSPYPIDAIVSRTTYSPGIILNVGELAALVHLPDPEQMPDALEVAGTGSAAPRIAKENILTPLGWNSYGGADTPVGISEEWMTRHIAVFGASGSGKSNLLSLFLSLVEEN